MTLTALTLLVASSAMTVRKEDPSIASTGVAAEDPEDPYNNEALLLWMCFPPAATMQRMCYEDNLQEMLTSWTNPTVRSWAHRWLPEHLQKHFRAPAEPTAETARAAHAKCVPDPDPTMELCTSSKAGRLESVDLSMETTFAKPNGPKQIQALYDRMKVAKDPELAELFNVGFKAGWLLVRSTLKPYGVTQAMFVQANWGNTNLVLNKMEEMLGIDPTAEPAAEPVEKPSFAEDKLVRAEVSAEGSLQSEDALESEDSLLSEARGEDVSGVILPGVGVAIEAVRGSREFVEGGKI
jgi:hypothetical protein